MEMHVYKKQYIDKKNFQNQKSDWVEKSKGFLIILLSYNENEHKYLN